MVTIGKKFGRLANRLWMFSYFAANAIEYGYQLTYRNFDEYIKYFDATSDNDFGGYPIRTRLSSNKIIDFLLYWKSTIWYTIVVKTFKKGPGFSIINVDLKGDGYNLASEEYLKLARGKHHLYIGRGGFWYKDHASLQKHKKLLREFFRPKQIHESVVQSFIAECKKNSDCLVGVHLRKKDFRKFGGGEHYFEDGVYHDNMVRINAMLKEKGFNPHFILCSDEPIDENNFPEVPITKGPNHLIEDLYAFALCDYLIGPPSTYSLWASFYGDVPLKFICNARLDYNLADFKVVENIDDLFLMRE